MKLVNNILDLLEGVTGTKDKYKEFFDKKLKKFGVNSPSELSTEDKKKFFDEIDKEWKGDHEKSENEDIEKLLNPRQANASSKKLKIECTMCGVKVPISRGRYPNNCPGCGEELDNESEVENT